MKTLEEMRQDRERREQERAALEAEFEERRRSSDRFIMCAVISMFGALILPFILLAVHELATWWSTP